MGRALGWALGLALLGVPGARADITLTPETAESTGVTPARNWAESAASLRRAWERSPSTETALELSKALVFLGRREEALQVLSQAELHARGGVQKAIAARARIVSRQFLTHATFQLHQDGLNFMRARKYRAARQRFEKALESEKDNVEVLVRLGQCLLLEGDRDAAAERLRLARRFNSDEAEVGLWLGRVFQLRGELEPALAELKAAKLGLPRSEEAQVWLAEALEASGARAVAMAQLERDLRDSPLNVRSLITLARMRFDGSGADAAALRQVSKELQLVRSRLAQYEAPRPEGAEFVLDLREPREVKSLLEELEEKLEKRQSAPQG